MALKTQTKLIFCTCTIISCGVIGGHLWLLISALKLDIDIECMIGVSLHYIDSRVYLPRQFSAKEKVHGTAL